MDGKFLILIFVGLFLVDSSDGISGGNDRDDYYMITVAAIYNSRHDYICTGTIISDDAIVTSASCLGYYADFNEGEINEKHRMALFARVLNNDRRAHKKINNLHITALKKHPNWDAEKPDYDCAVIKTAGFPKGTLKLSLPKGNNYFEPGLNVFILGWGASRENFPNEYLLQQGDPQIIPIEECREKYPDENLDVDLFFCTHKLRSGACSGDDGGPVIFRKREGKSVLIGIIGYRKGCGYPEYPDIHTHILSVKQFIVDNGGKVAIED